MPTDAMLKELVDTLRTEIKFAEENGYTSFPIDVGHSASPVELTIEGARALLAALSSTGKEA